MGHDPYYVIDVVEVNVTTIVPNNYVFFTDPTDGAIHGCNPSGAIEYIGHGIFNMYLWHFPIS